MCNWSLSTYIKYFQQVKLMVVINCSNSRILRFYDEVLRLLEFLSL
jgi:hypothetical protein